MFRSRWQVGENSQERPTRRILCEILPPRRGPDQHSRRETKVSFEARMWRLESVWSVDDKEISTVSARHQMTDMLGFGRLLNGHVVSD